MSRNPAAPAATAPRTTSGSSKVVSTRTGRPGCSRTHRRTSSIPSMTGIFASARTTSTSSARSTARASAPWAAWATTSTPSTVPKSMTRPRRRSCWSSTTRTRSAPLTTPPTGGGDDLLRRERQRQPEGVVVPARRDRAAQLGGALGQPAQPEAGGGAALTAHRRPRHPRAQLDGNVIGHRDEGAPVDGAHADVHRARPAVPEGVGQALLDRAVHEELGRLGERSRAQLVGHAHPHPRAPERRRHVLQARDAAVVLGAHGAQGPHPRAHLAHRLPARALGHRHLLPGGGGIRIAHAARELQAHPDPGQPVPEPVVQLVRGPRALPGEHELLLQHRPAPDLLQGRVALGDRAALGGQGGVVPGQCQAEGGSQRHENRRGDVEEQDLRRSSSQDQEQGG